MARGKVRQPGDGGESPVFAAEAEREALIGGSRAFSVESKSLEKDHQDSLAGLEGIFSNSAILLTDADVALLTKGHHNAILRPI
jgi:hypothetical protein